MVKSKMATNVKRCRRASQHDSEPEVYCAYCVTLQFVARNMRYPS
jgi:hypothetical protein